MSTLQQVIEARPSADGDGVKIHRIAGPGSNRLLDPFLMLDEIQSDQAEDYIGGFPPHPHRGFETITYMLAGAMRHRDHLGNNGVIEGGGVQWMTAGRGVIHSEMPEQEDGLLHGFQLWLNLPSEQKMQPARYRDIQAGEIPQVGDPGVTVKVIAGRYGDAEGPVFQERTRPVLLDVSLEPGAHFRYLGQPGLQLGAYVYGGATTELRKRQFGSFSSQGDVLLVAGDEGANVLLFGGRPLAEPIAQYGPFVMNTQEEIEQAIRDYNNGQLTGEAAPAVAVEQAAGQ
jgi:redox-sensitive bicupin YhaK (pirin superfamily)